MKHTYFAFGSIGRFGVLLTLVFGLSSGAAEIRGGEEALAAFKAEIVRLAETSGGVVGVGVHHLETGVEVYLNRDESFPLASTYKVAMAVRLLQRVEAGEIALSDMVTLQESDLVVSSTLTQRLRYPGATVSLRNLLELMIVLSDNTATDLVLEAAGGGARVTGALRDLGIDDMRVDRGTAVLIRDWLGMENPPPGEKVSLQVQFENMTEAELAGLEEIDPALNIAFNADPRDQGSPCAMVRLLRLIWSGEALNQDHSALLQEIMFRTETGTARLKGLLPEATQLAHKTGTIGQTTNDVGVIVLPGNKGHLIVTVFVKESIYPVEVRERAIAEIARAAHDFFVFNVTEQEPQ